MNSFESQCITEGRQIDKAGLGTKIQSQMDKTNDFYLSPRKLQPALRAERAEKDLFVTGQKNFFFGCLMKVISGVVK